jgi:hypothetical protein
MKNAYLLSVVKRGNAMSTKEQLQRQLAKQEFIYDQLSTELLEVDDLLKAIGFPRGLQSIATVAHEMLRDEMSQDEEC